MIKRIIKCIKGMFIQADISEADRIRIQKQIYLDRLKSKKL